VKGFSGFKAKGRNGMESAEGNQLREASAHYKALFGTEKDDIAPENTWFWGASTE